jgi:hypothetical protein
MDQIDIQSAVDILDINIEQLSSLTSESLKKQYHKMALLHHPDKCGNSHEATERFQRIQQSYHYLLDSFLDSLLGSSIDSSIDSSNEKEDNSSFNFSSFSSTNSYINYAETLSAFIKTIAKESYVNTELFSSIVKEIMSECKHISVTLFESVDKEVALEIYGFLVKHKHIIRIEASTLEQVRATLLNKYNNTHIIIINPTITDMFESRVYKLIHKKETYYVPLWQYEMYYDCLNDLPNELIIKCVPELPDNIYIDEQNNIHITVIVCIKTMDMSLRELQFHIENRTFVIQYSSICIKPIQWHTIKSVGIPRIDDTDMYNDSFKSDIIVKLILT